jgi:hypothetical protein
MGKVFHPSLDPRLTPARPDLAAKHLEGKVAAARYVEGVTYDIHVPQASLWRDPTPDAPVETEALMGERMMVYESNDEGWAWGQLENDGYVGWIAASALAPPVTRTHKVNALRTLAFPGTSIKVLPLCGIPFGARLRVERIENDMAVTSAGYVPAIHLVPIAERESDFVAVAERFVGVPYLWCGKTSLGIDCSGLIQVALNACGVPCPRDSDMQEATLGAPASLSDLQRGDLVFWKGHAAIARDHTTVVHANGHYMAVTIEPIAETIARIRKAESEVTSVRRI